MRGAEALKRLAYLAPLAAASLLAATMGPASAPPGLAFAAIAAYARLAALLSEASGFGEALLFADALPFLAFCLARLSGLDALGDLILAAEAAAILAALLLLEAATMSRRSPIAAALAFAAAAAACGAAVDRVSPASVIGGAAALACLAGYALARRAR